MPVKKWRRPTRAGLTSSALFIVAWTGLLLALTADLSMLIAVGISMLGGIIAEHYGVDEDTPFATRFSTPPDTATQLRVHEAVDRGDLPVDRVTRDLALDYAAGWARQLRRTLGRAVVGLLAWWVLAIGLTTWFNEVWPESATVRTWGLWITLPGSLAWLLHSGVPGARRLAALRRLSVHD